MSNSNQICFLPESGDTKSFASSVAINDKYLVVGDPGANRIVVYQKNAQGRWYREREIYPPENSTSYQRGNGFGISLLLGENALIVNNWSTNKATYKTDPGYPGSIFYRQYFIQLDREQEAIPIELSLNVKKGFISFYILSEDKPKLITLLDNNEDISSYHIKRLSNFALSKNLLLVGSPSRHMYSPNSGRGWLFNLQALNSEAIELASSKAFIGDTVALSEQFAVVGNRRNRQLKRTRKLSKNNISYPKTLIRCLSNGSTTVIDDWGRLGLDKNILTVMLPSSQSQVGENSVLKVFYLDENATPHLIQEQKYNRQLKQCLTTGFAWADNVLKEAWIQNGWLITIFRFGSMGHTKFCLESVKQITKN